MKKVVLFLSLLALCCCGKPDDESIKPPPASEPEETLPMVVVGYATYWDTEIPDPAWDYDIAFENGKRTCPINGLTDWLYYKKGSLASRAMKDMVSRIVKEDPEAKKRLVEIWDKACSDGKLTELNSYLDQTAALLQESQELNFKRWKILSEKVHKNFQALGSYDAEVQTVKDYITSRLVTLDKLVSR